MYGRIERIVELYLEGFYDVVFHRVIPGFMAQGGDPTGTGMGGSPRRSEAEFNAVPHVQRVFDGEVLCARQCQQPVLHLFRCAFLDNQYRMGRGASGMEHVDALPRANHAFAGQIIKTTVS
jgi:peptidylprolyl isomerase